MNKLVIRIFVKKIFDKTFYSSYFLYFWFKFAMHERNYRIQRVINELTDENVDREVRICLNSFIIFLVRQRSLVRNARPGPQELLVP
jgi:hypothetical protein